MIHQQLNLNDVKPIRSSGIITCVVKGVLGSGSIANSFSTRSSLKSVFISESMGKQKSSELST